MLPQIQHKLLNLITKGITSEAEAVYFLAAIRKIIEKEQIKNKYQYLNFHCNWALHTSLHRIPEILKVFGDAHKHYLSETDAPLDNGIENELTKISRMELFKKELELFLADYSLPSLANSAYEAWVRFLYLYCQIIEDCPLIVKGDQTNIEKVVINVENAKELSHGQHFYKINWNITGKDGKLGTYFVMNGFDVKG